MHQPRKLRLTVSVVLCFVLQSLGADNYNNNNGQTYEFGFKIDGQQHRHESKDKDGIIMGEFGFITADDVYHVTVYATDKEGRFKILSMKNIHLKSSPALTPGGPLSTRQGHALAFPTTQPVSGQASVVPQALHASTEKPTGSCASCMKIPDFPQKSTPPPYNNNNLNQFFAPGTGPQNKQIFASPNPYGQQITSPGGPSVSLNNKPALPHSPYGQQNTSPGGPSVSSYNEPAFPLSPYGQQNTSPGGPSVTSNNQPAFPPSPYGQQNTSPGGLSVSSNNQPAFPLSPYGQQNTSPDGPSVTSNNQPAFPLSPYGQQNTSPGGPSVTSNNQPAFPLSPYGQQNTSPGGPSVTSNNQPAFPLSPYGQQNTSPGGPSVTSNNQPAFPLSPYGQQNTSPGGPSVTSNNQPAFPPSPYGQQNTSPGGPSVSSNNQPAFPLSPYGQQNTSPGGPSVTSNNQPTFPPSPYGQQNTSPGGPSVSSYNEPAFPLSPYGQHNTSPDGPSVSSHNKHTGERTAKQLEPNGSIGPIQGPAKPTLVTAQLQIVDKNTDIYALGPNEMKGLPPGLSADDITTLLYTFNYTVGFHGHFEEGYTNGVKKGYYFVTGRNGVRTRIDYIADDTGFHPTISNDVLDLLSEDVPKPETEKDEKYGLKGYEFKWLFYPVESQRH